MDEIPINELPHYEIGPTGRVRKIRKPSTRRASSAETAQVASVPPLPLSPWQALGHSPALLRAIEVALTGTHSLRIVGHPENGYLDWMGFYALPEIASFTAERAASAANNDERQRLAFTASWHTPCACGFLGDPSHECTCSPRLVERYRRRLRATPYDIDVEAPRPRERDLANRRRTEPLSAVLARVEAARVILPSVEPEPSDPAARQLLAAGNEKLALTLEARGRVVSVARTSAALAGRTVIRACDIAEALIYQRDWRRDWR